MLYLFHIPEIIGVGVLFIIVDLYLQKNKYISYCLNTTFDICT